MVTTLTRSRNTWSRALSHSVRTFAERPGIMSNRRDGPVPSTTGVRSTKTAGERAAAVAADVLPFVLIDPENADAIEVSGLVVGHGAGLGDRQVVNQIPAQPEGLRDGGHAGAVDRQALQNPAAAPAGGLGPRLGPIRHALLENPRSALGVVAGEAWYAYVQSGGMADDRQIGHLPLDVVTQPPLRPAVGAHRVQRDRGAEQVR